MKTHISIILILFLSFLKAQSQDTFQIEDMEVFEVDNTFFSQDKFFRGADGAASIDLGSGKILWLYINLERVNLKNFSKETFFLSLRSFRFVIH